MLDGIDVSNWQGVNIDWTAVRRAGYRFAATKATEGIIYRDDSFQHNWAGMHRNMAKRLAYHYFHGDVDGVSQAAFLHNFVHNNGGFHNDDAVMLDIENYDHVSSIAYVEEVVKFILYILNTVERQVVVYIGRYFWEYLGGPMNKELAERPLWVPDYSRVPPEPFGPWNVVSFWQRTANGVLSGVPGNVDLDLFFGNATQLHEVLRHP